MRNAWEHPVFSDFVLVLNPVLDQLANAPLVFPKRCGNALCRGPINIFGVKALNRNTLRIFKKTGITPSYYRKEALKCYLGAHKKARL